MKHHINQDNIPTHSGHILENLGNTSRNQLTLIYWKYAPDTAYESNSSLPNTINKPSTKE